MSQSESIQDKINFNNSNKINKYTIRNIPPKILAQKSPNVTRSVRNRLFTLLTLALFIYITCLSIPGSHLIPENHILENLLIWNLFHQSPTDYKIYNDDPVGDRLGSPTLNPDSEHLLTGSKAMVASDVDICSTMGKQILINGGNAADAAVTVALCIGSVNLHSSGIGGGAFIVSSKGNESIFIDSREAAPELAHKHMYDGSPLTAQFGGLAVAIPGEVAGLYELYKSHGSRNLTWAQLFEPVIELNRNGWKAQQIWIRAARKMFELVLSKVPVLREPWDFIYKHDQVLLVEEGDLITRKNYARTLDLIAQNGSHAVFYDPNGPIVPHLVAASNRAGGILQLLDFAHYQPRVSLALHFEFTANNSTYEVITSGGVSSGLALIAGLNFYTALDQTGSDSTPILQQHRLIESMKWTSSARSNLGDVNETLWKELKTRYSSREWAEGLLRDQKYSDKTTFKWRHYEPLYEFAGKHGTSHFSVVDELGNAVGMTTTVNLLFGSMVYDNETGIVLNDEMDDFSLPNKENAFNLTPSVRNFIHPFQRPLSLMCPTILKKDGELDLIIGAAGGSRIVTAILQAIIRHIYSGMSLLEMISFPRLHHQLIPEFAMVENGTLFDEEFSSQVSSIQTELHKLKHDFYESGALTAMNGIKRVVNGWQGVSDYWRKRGHADGY